MNLEQIKEEIRGLGFLYKETTREPYSPRDGSVSNIYYENITWKIKEIIDTAYKAGYETQQKESYIAGVKSGFEAGQEEMKEKILSKIGLMRQWLNEDRITDPKKMVTSEELKYFLK